MKVKIILLLFLFAAVNVFAQEAVPAQQDAQAQKQEAQLKKEQEKQLKQQQKEEAKKLKEEEKLRKKELEQQRKNEEKEKLELEQKQKADAEKLALENKAKEEEEFRLKKQQEKEQKKAEKARLRLERKREKEKRKEDAAAKEQQEPNSSLVLDYDMKVRAASYSNLDYTSKKNISENVYQQYLSVTVMGKFDDRIDMSAKIASYGISGKYNDVFAMPYKDDDFSIFLENAYLNFRSEARAYMPYVITVGKQYFTAGDGMIIDGNNNGFLGARARVDLFQLFSVDAFAAKVDNQDFNLYGGTLKIKIFPLIEIGAYQERNDTGFAYQKGIFIDSPTYAIHSDIKTFYDIRITGGNKKYKYRLEAAQQTGELVAVSTDTPKVDYNSYAFTAEGSWSGTILKAESNAKILFSYAEADGQNAFNPTFSRRYNGLQRVGYGTLLAANNSDTFLTLPDGYGGINTLGAMFDTAPWKFLQTGIAFYLFSASDAPPDSGDAGFAKFYGAEADLGNEADFFVKYKYLHYFDITFNFAMYTPPSGTQVFLNTDTSYLYQIEVSAKF